MTKTIKAICVICVICGCLTLAAAQQSSTPKSTPTPNGDNAPVQAGEDAGDYTIISTLEFGYRGLSVSGDHNKYESDLNYRAGPRLFDSSFLMRSHDGKTGLFETALVTTTGWGADPNGQLRISVEQPQWYRFDGTYRKF
jgi:hypothetical protein